MRSDVRYHIEYKLELSNIESQSNSNDHTESSIILKQMKITYTIMKQ